MQHSWECLPFIIYTLINPSLHSRIHRPLSSCGIVGAIRLDDLASLKISTLHHSTSRYGITIERISTVKNREVRQAELEWITSFGRGETKIWCVDWMQADLKLEIAAVENFRPLKFAIFIHKERRGIIGFSNSDVLAVGAWAGHCGSCKFNTNAALTAGWVVCVVIEPD